jgi:hypothetical protein
MPKRFLLVLGVFLGSYLSTAAQTPAAQIVPAQERISPIMTLVRAAPPSAHVPYFPPTESPAKSVAHFSYLLMGAYERDRSLASLSPIREVRTLFLTQSSLPLLRLWGGRLQVDGFMSRLHMQNVQLGPSGAGGLLDFRPPRQGYMVGPRSVGLSGVNLSFHFGGEAQIERPTQIWRCLAGIAEGRAVRP